MPLIQITTKSKFHPRDDELPNLPQQAMTAEFADVLPALFVARTGIFMMDMNTPEAGVQVTHRKFHKRDVNAPDLWILIEFSEGNLSEIEQIEVTGRVKAMLLGWFRENGYNIPTDYAVDVRWNPSHGFLRIGDTVSDW
ncbi:MAG: hypothetical protein WCI47_03550 [bacterium]